MKAFSFRDDDATIAALKSHADEYGLPVATFARLVVRAYLRNPTELSLLGGNQAAVVTTKPKPTAHKEVAPWKKPDIDVAAVVKDWGD